MAESIDKLIHGSLDYYEKISKEYGYLGVEFTIYNTAFDIKYPSDIEHVRKLTDTRMVALFTPLGTHDKDKSDEEQIVSGLRCGIFMSYEMLYSLLIDCELDFNNALESMKFSLRHELGHVIDHYQSDIGITVSEWNRGYEQGEKESLCIPKLRQNASYKNRLRWYRMYNELPSEKRANDAVGITNEDIVADWKRTHPCN